MFHPATLLLIWLGFALLLPWLPAGGLAVVTIICLGAALVAAPRRSLNLLRRSRWLLLSLALLYAFVTPGEYLPGSAGVLGLTYDGLQQGGLQLGRLLALLTSLALLHERLGRDGLLAGFYWLLRPLPWRAATVVRLMLVLDFVEAREAGSWRRWLDPSPAAAAPAQSLILRVTPFRWRDRWLAGTVLLTLFAVALRS